MSSTGKVIIAIIVVAAVAGGAMLLNQKSDDKTSSDSSAPQSQSTGAKSENASNGSNANGKEDGAVAVEVTIKYDGTNFTLSSDKLKAGGTVRVANDSDNELAFDSDPHPVHTDNPELNAGDIAPGESKTFVIDKKGTWGFHNHLDSSQRGQLTVE